MEDKVNEILKNTREIKKIIQKEESKKSTSAQRRAEQRFKLVGTKLNQQEQIEFKEFLEKKGLNASQYIKSLILRDMNISNQDKTIEEKFILHEWIQWLLKIKLFS